jgi:hypothetical protein
MISHPIETMKRYKSLKSTPKTISQTSMLKKENKKNLDDHRASVVQHVKVDKTTAAAETKDDKTVVIIGDITAMIAAFKTIEKMLFSVNKHGIKAIGSPSDFFSFIRVFRWNLILLGVTVFVLGGFSGFYTMVFFGGARLALAVIPGILASTSQYGCGLDLQRKTISCGQGIFIWNEVDSHTYNIFFEQSDMMASYIVSSVAKFNNICLMCTNSFECAAMHELANLVAPLLRG